MEKNELVGHSDPDGGFAITKAKMEALSDFIAMTIKGGFAPKGTTVESGVCGIIFGLELGLNPMQSLQQVAVINGRPSLFGDGPLALCLKSGLMEGSPQESMEGSGDDLAAICTVKRVNSMPATKRFTVGMAKKANLWGKTGPWTQYPSRMLQVRARALALRDQFADVLAGIHIGEEARDIPNGNDRTKKVELPAADVIAAPTPSAPPPAEPASDGPVAPKPKKRKKKKAKKAKAETADQVDDQVDAPEPDAPSDDFPDLDATILHVEDLLERCKTADIEVGEFEGLPFGSFTVGDLDRIAATLKAKIDAA